MTWGPAETRNLRSAIAGLLGFAAAEEQVVLMATSAVPGTALRFTRRSPPTGSRPTATG
jgi:hypothetical protein